MLLCTMTLCSAEDKDNKKLPLGSCLPNVKYRDYFVGKIVQDDIF